MAKDTIRVGWLSDAQEVLGAGGAELSAERLVRHAPADFTILPCPPGNIRQDCDMYVVQNCRRYPPATVRALAVKPVIKVIRDVLESGSAYLKSWLLDEASLLIFSTQGQVDSFRWRFAAPWVLCPPPVDIDRFIAAKERAPDPRPNDVIWLGWFAISKGILEAIQWAEFSRRRVDFFGMRNILYEDTEFAKMHVAVPYGEVPDLLASYESFLMLPIEHEPFGRTVIEAYFAGCKLIVNRAIGALEWLDAIEAGRVKPVERFWTIVRTVALKGEMFDVVND